MNPIHIENVEKAYGDVQALRGISLDVRQGEVYGLIGPDGAGKTTLIRILVTLLAPDAGRVLVNGKDVGRHVSYVRSSLGYMPQRFSLYRDLTVEENLRFFGDLFAVPHSEQSRRLERLYEFSKLGPFKSRRAGDLSGGMKQKLALSCMLMHEPAVMVLDEPTHGVDPVSRSEFWKILQSLSAQGKSILVTTAYMDEAELCDRVGLIFEGEIMAQDGPAELRGAIRSPLYVIKSEEVQRVYSALRREEGCSQCTLFGDGVHFIDETGGGREGIVAALDRLQLPYSDVVPEEPDLEDVFLRLMHQRDGRRPEREQ
jgi:ABC-2 type transport system ATP-binding protein